MNPEPICVYVIAVVSGPGQTAAVKIGVAANPAARLAQLRTGSPFEMELVCCFTLPDRQIAMHVEGTFHHAYAHKRLKGEWFDLDRVTAARGMLTVLWVIIGNLPGDELRDAAWEKTGAADVHAFLSARNEGRSLQ